VAPPFSYGQRHSALLACLKVWWVVGLTVATSYGEWFGNFGGDDSLIDDAANLGQVLRNGMMGGEPDGESGLDLWN